MGVKRKESRKPGRVLVGWWLSELKEYKRNSWFAGKDMMSVRSL